ncbi:MAG: SDR family oxidoreductase [Nitrospira sp.]|nr:SDR family oxidoreductase [Nitrospira sp.]
MARSSSGKSTVSPHIFRGTPRPAVLVTGASGGIGRAISLAFGAIGWHIGIHYSRNKPAAESTLRQVRAAGGTGDLYQADIRKWDSVQHMIDAWGTCVPTTAAFICNAGIAERSLLVRQTERTWHEVIATNLTGTFHCLRAMAPPLLAHGGGSIIVIGSHTGFHGATGQAAYATSKAGLIGLVKSAAWEWGPQNVRVNLVLPGWQKTGLTTGIFPEGTGWPDHALHRPPSLEEAARTIVHLAQLKDVSGQVWNCDSRNL